MAQGHVLAASASRNTDLTADGVQLPGWWDRMIVMLDITVASTAAGDKLDVYIDFSLDGSKWFNACRFAQQLGNVAATTQYAIFDPANPGALTIDSTADCAAGVTRPSAFGKYARARWDVTDGTDAHFTFSVKAFIQ